jgi:hypothetical protein
MILTPFSNSGIQAFRYSGVQAFRRSGVLVFWYWIAFYFLVTHGRPFCTRFRNTFSLHQSRAGLQRTNQKEDA